MNKNQIAAAWIELQSLPTASNEADELIWASSELFDLAISSPVECWDFVLEILSLSNDEWVLVNLGAGPIEEMLSYHPEVSIALIEKELRKNRRLKTAAKNIWQSNIPDSVWNRLQALL